MNKTIVLLILFLIIQFSFKHNKDYEIFHNSNIENPKFSDIFPRINLDINKDNISYLHEIFNSKQLFINDINLTKKYIHFIRNIKEKEDNYIEEEFIKNQQTEIKFNLSYFNNNEKRFNYTDFGKLCIEEKLIKSKKITDYKPIISIILPSFNKSNVIMKSIRSIQNQSFKNIEIIIVDDCSTDNSSIYYKYLLETDQRIRIFTHLKNMGVWRARINGFLYSRGKYIIHFDTGDLYSDPFVLEDAYNLIEKYKLDSIKMMFRLIYNYNNIEHSSIPFEINSNYTKIVYEPRNIKKYNKEIFTTWGNIWTRLTRSNIISKGLYLLDSKILNIYKNLWEDVWWNILVNYVIFGHTTINRVGYIYFKSDDGEGNIKIGTEKERDNTIKEFINFWLFDYQLLPKDDKKKNIIENLRKYSLPNNTFYGTPVNLNYLNTNFTTYSHLLVTLINDYFVDEQDKNFVGGLLNNYTIKFMNNITYYDMINNTLNNSFIP